LDTNLGDIPFFILSFVGAILFSIVGIKNTGYKESIHANMAFTILGILLGIIVSSLIANLIYGSFPSVIDKYPYFYFGLLLLIWVLGALLGHWVGNQYNAIKLEQGVQKQSKLSKFFSYYVFSAKRVEGNYIIYEVDTKRYRQFTIMLLIVGVTQYFAGIKYVWFTVLVIIIDLSIGSVTKLNDSLRAISRKKIVKENGIIEYWYEVE